MDTSDSGYKNLIVWQKTDELAILVYKLTSLFPKTEQYAMTSQIRRAALSVPTNIVEGYARNSKTEFRRFVVIALGSLAEVKYLLDFSFRLDYLTKTDLERVNSLASQCGQLLWKFYKSF